MDIRLRFDGKKEKDKVIINFLENTYSPLDTIKAILYMTAKSGEPFALGGLAQAEINETYAQVASGQNVPHCSNMDKTNRDDKDKVEQNDMEWSKQDTHKDNDMDKIGQNGIDWTNEDKEIDSDLLAMFNV